MTPWSALSRQAAATIEKTPIDPCVNLRPHGDQKFAGLDFRHDEVCFHQYAGVLIQPVKLLAPRPCASVAAGNRLITLPFENEAVGSAPAVTNHPVVRTNQLPRRPPPVQAC